MNRPSHTHVWNAALAVTACAPLAAVALAPNATAGLLSSVTSAAPDLNWTLGGHRVHLIEVPAAAPVGAGPCAGVRPGAIVESDTGQCTFNFLFTGSDGATYMGTAGHCILGESPVGGDVGEETWPVGEGPEARDSTGARIGEFTYAILEDPKDFALVLLDPGVAANAQMCHFGGPTGINDDRTSNPVLLHHFGNGLAIGSVLPARTHVATGMPHSDHVFADGAALPGDSGSGVISEDGRAVGVLVTVGVHLGGIGTAGVDAGVVGITRLTPQVERAEQVLGIDLTLAPAPAL
ncbi:MAG TPA: hypothetical protein VEC57_02230 [Candidatus Limnocylindrales bacterium]|nr:hypothetical protein [Candidatus Limnocylindrales bacterium]